MNMLNIAWRWSVENYQWLVGIVVQGLIAYHVYFLSKRLSDNARLEHREKIKKVALGLLSEIYQKKLDSEVYLVNLDRYFNDYPSNKEKHFQSYSHIRAEIKGVRFDGIEFFSGMPVDVYKKENGELSFGGKDKQKAFIAYPVGLVPYEWIDYVDIRGDEYAFVPLFYCRFKGKTHWKFWKRLLFFGYPYKRITYYKIWEHYKNEDFLTDRHFEPILQKITNN